MKEIAMAELLVGMTVLMKIGSPVRQWMLRIDGGSKKWLLPLRYTPAADNYLELTGTPRFVRVKIARIMLPYLIVLHHDGRGWIKLWLDTREVGLFASNE